MALGPENKFAIYTTFDLPPIMARFPLSVQRDDALGASHFGQYVRRFSESFRAIPKMGRARRTGRNSRFAT